LRYVLGIYWRMLAIHIRSQMQYRSAFFMETLSTALATFLAFLTLALVLERFDNISGWRLAEIAFLYGMVEAAFGVMDMIFSGYDPANFGTRVRMGSFDQMLLRPISLTLQVFGSDFQTRRLGRIFQGLLVLGFAFSQLQIEWTILKLIYLPVVAASLIAFFGGLFIIGATITFWTIESIEFMNIFTYGGSEMMSYPMNIYPPPLIRFFTFIVPAIFLNYSPALYFLDKPDPLGLPGFAPFLAPAAGFGVLAAAMAFWKYGIRHYQSTGT
jgi:ABC-2 type transport system permease protein